MNRRTPMWLLWTSESPTYIRDFDAPFICQWCGWRFKSLVVVSIQTVLFARKLIFRLLVSTLLCFYLSSWISLFSQMFDAWWQCQFKYVVLWSVFYLFNSCFPIYVLHEYRIEKKACRVEYPPISNVPHRMPRIKFVWLRLRWWFCKSFVLVLIVSISICLTSVPAPFLSATVWRFADSASKQPTTAAAAAESQL